MSQLIQKIKGKGEGHNIGKMSWRRLWMSPYADIGIQKIARIFHAHEDE